VVILTTFDLDEYVFEAICCGASGFLLKDSPPDQLTAANPPRRRGRGAARPHHHQTADRGARPPPHPAPGTARAGPAHPRELDVLKELARGLSNAEIAGDR